MKKYDLKLLKESINGNLDSASVEIADKVIYVDFNDPNQFVVMPEWFKELTTVPGIPFGYICEFVGLPNAGKTTAGIIYLIKAQQQGHIAILVDVERKFPFKRFVAMGGNLDNLIVIKEPSIEETFNVIEITQKTIHEQYPDAKLAILYDSIAVGSTRSDLGKSALDPQVMADQAKVLKRMLRRQVVLCEDTRCSFVAINQMYGNPNPAAHGAPTMSAGKGMEYAKALSITFKKAGKLPPKTVNGIAYERGIITKALTTKNHLQESELSLTDVILHVTANDMTKAQIAKGKAKKNGKTAVVVNEEEVEVELESDKSEELVIPMD